MDDIADTAQVIIRPPLAWGLAAIAGLSLNWLVPLSFLPDDLPAGLLGAMVFVLALALFAWAIVTITRSGSNVPTSLPTTFAKPKVRLRLLELQAQVASQSVTAAALTLDAHMEEALRVARQGRRARANERGNSG